jgi:hypothetical protein
MSVRRVKREVIQISVDLDPVQYSLLAVALDHMWERLDGLIEEGVNPDIVRERITKLKLMQRKFEV